ncbi:16S rRNA (guanine(527)-N(7))-methyltransferase RsmG [Aliiroseovarius sp. 2305UL8-7]|uniref:16S rRNA (guanine(527)-N(7))-methyltransferase RsmG n=1 Tax=Aliiroseovarius conchicola TaxID=3121637 RepID=UPI003526ECD6
MSKDALLDEPFVSRETMERLEIYAGLLSKWNPAINLVAPSTISDLWTRHFLDSIQVYEQGGVHVGKWCDLGTGGGFPGLITAIVAQEHDPDRRTICIESDVRKATFLRTVIRETGINVSVIAQRIEQVSPQGAEVVSARALAPLDRLLGFAQPHLSTGGICIFLKGENYQSEVNEALENWQFDLDTYPSKTNPNAVVMRIGDLKRA